MAPVNRKAQVRVSICTAFTIECVENKLLAFPYLEIDQVFALKKTALKKDLDLFTNRYVWDLFPHEANLAQEQASGDCADGSLLYNYAYATLVVSNLCPNPCIETSKCMDRTIHVIARCTR